ncbi:MAG: YceI family protein [Rhodanobacter sp.]
MHALRYLAFVGLFGVAASVQAAPVTYQLDPHHTMVLASWSHFGYSHPTANFGMSEGTLVFDPQHPAQASVQVNLPLALLDTHVPELDKHLKKADFFDASKYPAITFKSTKVQPLGGDKFTVTGDLTIHGVTRPIVLNATLNQRTDASASAAARIGFDATASLKRSDFGVSTYTPKVGDEITIRITTEGSSEAPAAK